MKQSIPVVQHSFNPDTPGHGYWDQWQLIESLLYNYDAPNTFFYNGDYGIEQIEDGCILMLPARSQVDYVDEINEQINKWRWVVLVLTGDEENVFPVDRIQHPNKIIYLMSPHFEKDLSNVDRFIGSGYTQHLGEEVARHHRELDLAEKPLDVFFSGQINHLRREQCLAALEQIDVTKEINGTAGFTQGLSKEEYILGLSKAKVAPAPSGPMTPDSFRFFEALELGAVPLADTTTPDGQNLRYWQRLFGQEDLPFELITDWEHVGGNISKVLNNWPSSGSRCFAWWQNYKRDLAIQFTEDVMSVSGLKVESSDQLRNQITAVICTSPIRSHPDTTMIQETLDSIRQRLPLCTETIIMIDGIRPEQEYLRAQYEEYVYKLLHICNDYDCLTPVVFDTHMHQSGMLKAVLPMVRTPNILFVEHDTPLIGDIDFQAIVDAVNTDAVNVVRLHHETHVLPDHEHMMLDSAPVDIAGAPLLKTVQWSQRPHVAKKSFYERILREHFSENARTMIEDVMHGKVHAPYVDRGRGAWLDFKLWMYCPDPLDMKRSGNLDGRGEEDKYGMVL